MSERLEFGELDNVALAALIFELASQLHIERTRLLALQAALEASGVCVPAAIEAASESTAFRAIAVNSADASIRKLLRVLSESSEKRVPLRG